MSNYSKPRRIVTRSGGILRGIFASTKYCKQIAWEGNIEKDAVVLFEFSHHILDVSSQPFKSTFVHGGKKTSRTPDFLVTTNNEKIIVECKPKDRLDDPKVQAHMEIGKQHFESDGYRYFIATNDLLRHGYALVNARHLLPYRIRPLQRKEEVARILHQLDSLKNKFSEPSFSSAINFLNSGTDVLVMMASGLLFFDFQTEIQEETQLFYKPTLENHDAASFLFS
ncbi:TnsA endonuclease N-terminal domain-containing protein [Undibacterium sp. TS12]|uniref:TnsA endonuclease N-terminal domain-containing protein n=1 Tax=Undibacterium sp. TS12 TaxID=2908202 RepID=UPI001F4C6509|nr:TnsA endonuclease N-terminal domain-containing protein [Undibacterium sp. TS12]MCH8618151.1 TnsA endonuclease N-terminal domain-containing protein [Undibacterium sp. TS12]